ncbi:MAG: TlpA family protein disulfide reductase [Planctomycetaceae bacterium]|jgi:peroxiredoxin|nr:TlpA family protein disulfide reductase [Planctomycetaceae bacterium]
MGKWLMRMGAMVLAAVVLTVTGCPPKSEEKPPAGAIPDSLQPPSPARPSPEPVEKEPTPIDVSETLEKLEPKTESIPETKLTKAQRDTCLVWVGDALPAGEVAKLDGEKVSLADLLGKKGSVVIFWSAGSSEIAEKLAAQALADLQGDAQAAFGDKGLAVIAINPKDPVDKVKEVLGTAKVDYPVLLDDGGSLFAKVASEGLPRVYVLDEAGKIAWLDIEFSEVTRETLKRTLPVVLGDSKAGKE